MLFKELYLTGTISKKVIKAEHLNIIIKKVAKDCNLPNAEDYSSHSLRRGFATTASQQGASLSAIMKQGRWLHSDTALGYVEEGQRFENNAASLILEKRAQTQPEY